MSRPSGVDGLEGGFCGIIPCARSASLLITILLLEKTLDSNVRRTIQCHPSSVMRLSLVCVVDSLLEMFSRRRRRRCRLGPYRMG